MRLFVFLFCFAFGQLFAQNVNLSGGAFYEGEPFIAMNPADNNHLVVAWMGFQFGQQVVIKTKVSFDGGMTWSGTSILQHVVSSNGSADPSVRFDNAGNVFVCYIDFDNTNFSNGAVVVSSSTDGGLNWNSPVEAINIGQCPNQLCIDRPWMVIDNSGGTLDGTIYVTSMNAGETVLVTPPFHPYLAVSTDNGNSFGPLRFLDTTNYLVGSIIDKPMPTPAVAADGRFIAIYPSYETSQSLFAQVFMASSYTAGASLSHALVGQSAIGFSENSTKKGPLLIASEFNPNHYAYLFLSEIQGDLDIFLVETLDAGLTWSPFLRVNDDAVGNNVLQDLVWADFNESDDLVVCWRDRRNGGQGFSSDSDIYAAVKYSDSSNFSSNFPVTDITVQHDPMLASSGNDFMSVVFSGDTLLAVWGDVRNSVINIFYNKMSVTDPVLDISTISSSDWSLKPLYPNPAKRFIQLDESLIGWNYELLASDGSSVKSGVLTSSNLDISTLNSGSYILIVESNNELHSFSFLKAE